MLIGSIMDWYGNPVRIIEVQSPEVCVVEARNGEQHRVEMERLKAVPDGAWLEDETYFEAGNVEMGHTLERVR